MHFMGCLGRWFEMDRWRYQMMEQAAMPRPEMCGLAGRKSLVHVVSRFVTVMWVRPGFQDIVVEMDRQEVVMGVGDIFHCEEEVIAGDVRSRNDFFFLFFKMRKIYAYMDGSEKRETSGQRLRRERGVGLKTPGWVMSKWSRAGRMCTPGKKTGPL